MSDEIQKFDPTAGKLAEMVEASKGLVIGGPDDKKGYDLVHDARVGLKSARVSITKIGKSLREAADLRRKQVFEEEKRLIAIIEPEELRLKEMQDKADIDIEKLKRVASMPAREGRLTAVEAEYTYDQVLGMEDNEFEYFFNTQHATFLKRKEDALAAEKTRLEELEKAKAEAVERGRQEAEAVERGRQEAEASRKRAEESEALRAAADKAALERDHKYQTWLAKNGAKDAPPGAFIVQTEGQSLVLYKKIDSIIL